MKKLFEIVVIIIFFVSCKNNNLEINIVNSSLNFHDSVKIKLKNNTEKNYLFYFEYTKFSYFSNSKNNLIAEINNDNKPVKVEVPSGPLYILNEDGTYNDYDIEEMKRYQKNSRQNLIKIVPAKSSVFFTMKLIDTLTENDIKEYPILEKDKSYKLTLKVDADSNLITKRERYNIRSRYKNISIFQGKLVSNTINLK